MVLSRWTPILTFLLTSAPACSRPIGISITHKFLHLSDLSNAQVIHSKSNDLTNVEIEFYEPSDIIYQSSFKNSSVSDGYERVVEFQRPSRLCRNAHRLGVNTYLRVIKLLLMHSLSRRTCTLHRSEPPSRLLLNLAFHVYDILKNAYLFPNKPHFRAILLKVMSQQGLFRSHDFSVYLCKMCRKLQYSSSQLLCNIIQSCCAMRVRLPPCSFYLQRYCLSHQFRLSSKTPHIYNAHLFTATPVHFSPSPAPRGGGASRILSWTIIEPYVLSSLNFRVDSAMLLMLKEKV